VGEERRSARFHAKRRFLSARLAAANDRIWNHPQAARLYPSVLFRAHCISRASVPLLFTAMARLESLRDHEPAAVGLIEYLTQLAAEETGHDEWLLEDLEGLGIARQEVLSRVPPIAVASLVGGQYYWVLHHHPVAVLGFIGVLEADPPSPEKVEDAIRRTGLPRTAFRSFLRHSVIEPAHNRLFDHALDTAPLTDDHLALVGVSMISAVHLLSVSAEEIVDLYEIKTSGAAPPPEPLLC